MPAELDDFVRLKEILKMAVELMEDLLPGPPYTAKSVDTVLNAIRAIEESYYRENPTSPEERAVSYSLEQLAEAFHEAKALQDSDNPDEILVHKYLIHRFPEFFSGE